MIGRKSVRDLDRRRSHGSACFMYRYEKVKPESAAE